jgi:ubiquinone biosynthesis UbiH/UbiF/VisC/COQ6 family hydroxylase
MKTSKKYDVVIVGGGLVGASLAAALKDSGLALALVEAGMPPDMTTAADDWDSRIYALSPGSRTFLEQSGAWSLLDNARISPVEEMLVFCYIDSKMEFSAYQMGVAELACILENRHLQHALWQVLHQQDNLDLIHPARCAALTFAQEAAQLTLEDGSTLSASLVVGADGRNSWVRNQAGISAAPVDYQHHGVVANFSCEFPHRGIAHQWFAPDGILALLPLPENRVSMVWSVTPEKSSELMALTNEALCEHVAIASLHTLGKLTVITAAAAFPLRLLTLPHISAPRVALIGDAAHNMHPLAGQGVNTGFRDARQLAELLIHRGGCADCGDAQLLHRYDRKRREDIATMQGTTYALKNLFCNDDPLLRTLRNLGLNATNQLVPLKKALMRHAFN